MFKLKLVHFLILFYKIGYTSLMSMPANVYNTRTVGSANFLFNVRPLHIGIRIRGKKLGSGSAIVRVTWINVGLGKEKMVTCKVSKRKKLRKSTYMY